MAMEAKNDMQRKHLAHISKASEEQRQEIMRIKAEKYEKLRRGEYGDLSEKELADVTVDVSLRKSHEYRAHKAELPSLTANGKNRTTGQTTRATSTNPTNREAGVKKSGRSLMMLFPARKSNTLTSWEEHGWAQERKPERQSSLDKRQTPRFMTRWKLLMPSSQVSDPRMLRYCKYHIRNSRSNSADLDFVTDNRT